MAGQSSLCASQVSLSLVFLKSPSRCSSAGGRHPAGEVCSLRTDHVQIRWMLRVLCGRARPGLTRSSEGPLPPAASRAPVPLPCQRDWTDAPGPVCTHPCAAACRPLLHHTPQQPINNLIFVFFFGIFSPPSMPVTTPLPSLCTLRMIQLPQPMSVTSSPSAMACIGDQGSAQGASGSWRPAMSAGLPCLFPLLASPGCSTGRLVHALWVALQRVVVA